MQCTKCGHVSLSFDPFNVLSLPVPARKDVGFTVKYMPCNFGERPAKFQLNVGEYVRVSEIRERVEEYLVRTKYPDGEPDEDWVPPFLARVAKKQNISHFQRKTKKIVRAEALEHKNQEIIMYEREPPSVFGWSEGDSAQDFHICEIRMT